MSKKATTKQAQLLSPENYIRQKSRNIPIYKCWINSDWEESRIANILIARKHANGNLSACAYLADLGCLGVKDSFYFFNIFPEEVEEMLLDKEIEFIEISYPLAHNIIYATLEFAEEYGFMPHKVYTQTTRFFLEEDTEDIPLIEIECGNLEDGKPMYINTGFESPAREKQIIAQLDKTAGEGNYSYITDEDDEFDDDEDDYEEDDDYDLKDEDYEFLNSLDEETLKAANEIYHSLLALDHEELKALFLELSQKDKEDISEKEVHTLIFLTHLLMENNIDKEAVDTYLDELKGDLDVSITDIDELPNSLFTGIHHTDPESVTDLFFDTLDAFEKSELKWKKAIAEFRDEVGDVPVIAYLELARLEKNNDKQFTKKLEEYYTKYPDYFLIQMLWYVHLFQSQTNIIQKNVTSKTYKSLLSESNKAITHFEQDSFITHYLNFFIETSKISQNYTDVFARIIAFENYMLSNSLDEDNKAEFSSLLFVLKTTILEAFLTNSNT
ncbi:hypothetical protein AGMMS49574_00840 [Bacteroidia bacterium]|nr:hypothetical protein AGMMS49574_00840 [Bacteroidia bacterium]